MTLTALFERLGAPLVNHQWSWGAQRPRDGAIFLRVWQDESRDCDGKRYMRLVNHGAYVDMANLGYEERLRHIIALKEGAKGFGVLVRAPAHLDYGREVASFDHRQLFEFGDLKLIEGDEWAAIVGRPSVRSIASLGRR